MVWGSPRRTPENFLPHLLQNLLVLFNTEMWGYNSHTDRPGIMQGITLFRSASDIS
jgi:hypothetical protein